MVSTLLGAQAVPTRAAPHCRGKKWWEAESLCLDCHSFSFRAYKDPDFKTPEEWEKEMWTEMCAGKGAPAAVKTAAA